MAKKWKLGKTFESAEPKPRAKAADDAPRQRSEAALKPPAQEPEGFEQEPPKRPRELNERQLVDDRPLAPPPSAAPSEESGDLEAFVRRGFAEQPGRPPGSGRLERMARRLRRLSGRERLLIGVTLFCLLISGGYWGLRLSANSQHTREVVVPRVIENIAKAVAFFEFERKALPDSMEELAMTDYLGGDPSAGVGGARFFYAPVGLKDFAVWESGPNGATKLDQRSIGGALTSDLLRLNELADSDDSVVVYRVDDGAIVVLFARYPPR